MNKIEICESEYEKLLDDQIKLSLLEKSGIDKWNKYNDVMKLYESIKKTLCQDGETLVERRLTKNGGISEELISS